MELSAAGRAAAKPVVAVVPFGARARADEAGAKRAGAWARQIARRLVDRLSAEPALEIRPVFLVAVPEQDTEAGYLVFGSTPDPTLAAEYGRSLGASHTLTGTYREDEDRRTLAASLVDAGSGATAATLAREIPAGELHLVEPALAAWLADALAVPAPEASPAVANEPAYGALLEGMDAEVDSTLLRASDPSGAAAAASHAASRYVDALRHDPGSDLAEDRLLVLAATSLEGDDPQRIVPALEDAVTVRPRSWRTHYLLGELRRHAGDVSGAIVALEHADALRPLRDADALLLARLHIMAGANASADSRIRKLIRTSADPTVVAGARRLRLGLKRPDLERALEEAGRLAVEGDPARVEEADAGFARVLAVEPDIWEAHFGRGLIARQRGDAEGASAAFRRARELDPRVDELVAELEAEDEA